MNWTYSTNFVRELLAAMLTNGVDEQALMDRSGLRRSMLRNPLTRISHEVVEEMFHAAAALHDYPDWGFRIARYLSENSQRLTTLILFTAPSIREGLHRCKKFARINSTRAHWTVTDEPSEPIVRTTFHIPGLDTSGPSHHMVEATLGAISLYVARFAGTDAIPGYVSFCHAQAAPLHFYEEFFPEREIRFDAEFNELGYLRENLDKHSPLAEYNRQIYSSVVARADALYATLFQEENISDEVQSAIREQLTSDPEALSLEIIAAGLEMSPRTLQRKLSRGGLVFNDLADAERRSVFETLATDPDRTIAELTRLCGFSSRESLYRRVRRWHGVSLAEYRERLPPRA